MHVPATPFDESTRLNALRALDILDTQPEERFDRFTRIAKGLFDVPIALVSLVDEHRQWFKSRSGLDAFETPRDVSFCGHAILGDSVFVVPDTHADDRFVDNPLVIGEPYIRFYAGCPLALPNGQKVGTLCIIDNRARRFTDPDIVLLRDLSMMVTHELLALQLATMDDLTKVSNRRGFETFSQHALSLCSRLGKSAKFIYFDLDNFKSVNDRFGHAEGDFALARFAELLKVTFRDSDVIGRLGGDEFGALIVDGDPAGVDGAIQRLREAVLQYNDGASRGYDIEYSVGSVNVDNARDANISALISDADQLMYVQKKSKTR